MEEAKVSEVEFKSKLNQLSRDQVHVKYIRNGNEYVAKNLSRQTN